jgi:GWxTD domain-containing protein
MLLLPAVIHFKKSMLNKNRSALFLLLIFTLIGGCKIKNAITVVNFAPLYQESIEPEITGIRVFHETDSISRLYVRYRPNSLLYLLKQGRTYLTADYKFSFKVFDSFVASVIRDSATHFLYDSLFYQQKSALVYALPIVTANKDNSLLELIFTDQNANRSVIHSVDILKESPDNAQFFLTVDEHDGVIFEDWLSWKTKFRIITSDTAIKSFTTDYYKHDFPAAAPPFSMEHLQVYDLHPEETFTEKIENGTTRLLQYGREGFFHFRPDDDFNSGLTVFRFNDDYPEITDDHLLLQTLRYLTTNAEYKKLNQTADSKAVWDQFWLEASGNADRAKLLAKSYYERVVIANRQFPSYKEGWKTDRGMIYIVFGRPKTVYRRTNIESWIYGEAGKRVSLRFDFVKVDNQFSANDYELIRKPEYKNPYFISVDFWRR